MTATALYQALVDAGANEDLAREAVESVVYAPQGATKSDLTEATSALRAEIAEFRSETKTEIAELRTELKADNAELRTELKGDIAGLRSELKGDIAGLELRMERGFRAMTWRFVGLLLATQALLFAALRLTGTS